ERRVDARVVELDPLTDAIRTGAEDHHPRPVRVIDLRLLLVGGVVIRRASEELTGTGVDRLEHGGHAERLTPRSDGRCRTARELADAFIREPQTLRPAELVGREVVEPLPHELARALDHLCDLVDEPRVDPGRPRDLID